MSHTHSSITDPLFAAVGELRQIVDTEMERLNQRLMRTTRHLIVTAAIIMAAANVIAFMVYKWNAEMSRTNQC